jgi:hypothetical protein
LHVRWSEPIKAYNLDRREDRLRVYEQVPCEGTVDDIHTFVRLDDLIDLWGDLVIPENVRSAWRDWLVRHGAHLGC